MKTPVSGAGTAQCRGAHPREHSPEHLGRDGHAVTLFAYSESRPMFGQSRPTTAAAPSWAIPAAVSAASCAAAHPSRTARHRGRHAPPVHDPGRAGPA
jgi:hypothetical protein